MHILVIDDNPFDCDGIAALLKERWSTFDIGTAGSAKQALSYVTVNKPDIVLSDIDLPKTNGITLVKQICELYPDIGVIFVSCHNEFEYAKSAIDLKATAYILKPVIAEELISAVENIIHLFEQKHALFKEHEEMVLQLKQSLPFFQEQFFRELLFGHHMDNVLIKQRLDYLEASLPDNYTTQLAFVKLHQTHISSPIIDIDNKYLIAFSLKRLFQTFNSDSMRVFPIQHSPNEFILIFLLDHSQTHEKEIIIDAIVSINEILSEQYHLNAGIGVSKSSNTLSSLSKLYDQARQVMQSKFYSENNHVLLYEEIEGIANTIFEDQINLQELLIEIKEIIADANPDRIATFVNRYTNTEKLLTSVDYIKSFALSVICTLQMVLLEDHIHLDDIFGDQAGIWKKLNHFETILDARQWLINILRVSTQFYETEKDPAYHEIVDKLKAFISENFDKHITLADIANVVNFSPSHTTNIFKKETGQTLFDYLYEFRMEKAKQLLRMTNSRIYIVADAVGYTNKSHFCLQFKKYTGLTPAEFKKKFEK